MVPVALVLLASCSSAQSAKSAGSKGSTTERIGKTDVASAVRAAATRSLASHGARLRGSVSSAGDVVDVVAGEIDFRQRTVSLRNASPSHPPSFPSYETRLVDGWSYFQVDPANRPPRLRSSAQWVAVRSGYSHGLPTPRGKLTMTPTFVFNVLDALRTKPLVEVRFVASAGGHPTRVQYRAPSLDDASTISVTTVSIDAHGQIDEIAVATRFRRGTQIRPEAQERITLTYVDAPSKATPPPSDHVQRLAPNEDLFAPSPR